MKEAAIFLLQLEQKKRTNMFPARLELATFRVWGGRDNHYTTETTTKKWGLCNWFTMWIELASLGQWRLLITDKIANGLSIL